MGFFPPRVVWSFLGSWNHTRTALFATALQREKNKWAPRGGDRGWDPSCMSLIGPCLLLSYITILQMEIQLMVNSDIGGYGREFRGGK